MNSVYTMFCAGSQLDVDCKICHKANTVFCTLVHTTSDYTIQKHEIFISDQNYFANNEFLFLLYSKLIHLNESFSNQ